MAMRPGADNIEPAAGGEEKGIDFTLADAKLSDVPKSDTSSVALGSGVELQFGPDESVYPPTKQERLQEFVDGFGRVGKLYSDSVQDRGRF
ncbi:MAG: hypothetical protein K8F91_13375, partial [Candidatus Obscuribacterales bacterium]|nr:hypothetical protein [Candidatus Obscuribacterales bacterium]